MIKSTLATAKHINEWVEGSGIRQDIAELNVESVSDRDKIKNFLGWESYTHTGGWICRGIDPYTRERATFGQFKPDTPLQFHDKPKPAKYLSPKGSYDAMLLEMPDSSYWQAVIDDPSEALFITEGTKKAGAILTCGYAGIALAGVEMGLMENQAKLVSSLKKFAQPDRPIYLLFDADIIDKEGVRIALKKLGYKLKAARLKIYVVTWDIALGKGIDDVLINHGAEKVTDIISEAQTFKAWLNTQNISQAPESKKQVLPEASEISAQLAEDCRDRLAWNIKAQDWYYFNAPQKPNLWSRVSPEFVGQKIVETLRTKYSSCGFSHGFVQSVLGLVRMDLADECNWNSYIHLLPFTNGVLDLHTMKLGNHASGYKFTWSLPYDYDPIATCTPIKDWLLNACEGNSDRVRLLQAYLRAIVLGRSDLEKFVELLGAGGTGKSTFTRLAIALVGRENTFSTTLAALEKNPYETSAIRSKRLILINDSERYSGAISVLKSITGNDFVRTEEKFKQRDDGGAIVKAMVLITSNEPSTASSDYTSGLQRRRITIPFMRQIKPSERKDLITISDSGVSGEFAPYLSGLMNWVLSMTDADMKQCLISTNTSCPSLSKWIAEQILDNNPIASWLDLNCVFDAKNQARIGIAKEVNISTTNDGVTTSSKRFEFSDSWLYANYATYCKDHGIQRISLARFSRLLIDLLQNQLQFKAIKGRDRTGSFITGIRLRIATDGENYPISGDTVTALVTTCDDSVTAESIDRDKRDGCDGFFETSIYVENIEIISSENNFSGVIIENKSPQPSHSSPVTLPAITLPVTQPVTIPTNQRRLNECHAAGITAKINDSWIDATEQTFKDEFAKQLQFLRTQNNKADKIKEDTFF